VRTVVIGGQGFIGREVVRELLRRGDEVVVFDRSASQDRCDQLFGPSVVRATAGSILGPRLAGAVSGADEIYHLAGTLGTSELDTDVRHAVDANIVGAVNVFDAAVEADTPKVFHASKPNIWLNAYTITKWASEQFVRLYTERHQVQICCLRYFNAYGPGQAMHPVRKLVPTFAAQAMRGQPLTVYGDGEQTVDMVYSPDLGKMTVAFTRSGHTDGIPDCGRGVARTVNEVAALVNEFFGSRAGTVHLPMRRGETPNTVLVADVGPLEKVIGPLPLSDWSASLSTTLEWYAARAPAEIDKAVAMHGAG
jgi:UDP-glucose 4-epimerase